MRRAVRWCCRRSREGGIPRRIISPKGEGIAPTALPAVVAGSEAALPAAVAGSAITNAAMKDRRHARYMRRRRKKMQRR